MFVFHFCRFYFIDVYKYNILVINQRDLQLNRCLVAFREENYFTFCCFLAKTSDYINVSISNESTVGCTECYSFLFGTVFNNSSVKKSMKWSSQTFLSCVFLFHKEKKQEQKDAPGVPNNLPHPIVNSWKFFQPILPPWLLSTPIINFKLFSRSQNKKSQLFVHKGKIKCIFLYKSDVYSLKTYPFYLLLHW